MTKTPDGIEVIEGQQARRRRRFCPWVSSPSSRVLRCLDRLAFLLPVWLLGFSSLRDHTRLVCPHATTPPCGLLYAPGPDHGPYPIPKAHFTFCVIRSGLIVSYPTKDGRIWDGPSVSAPEPNLGLELRTRAQVWSTASGRCHREPGPLARPCPRTFTDQLESLTIRLQQTMSTLSRR
jgi:hypothetical protein